MTSGDPHGSGRPEASNFPAFLTLPAVPRAAADARSQRSSTMNVLRRDRGTGPQDGVIDPVRSRRAIRGPRAVLQALMGDGGVLGLVGTFAYSPSEIRRPAAFLTILSDTRAGCDKPPRTRQSASLDFAKLGLAVRVGPGGCCRRRPSAGMEYIGHRDGPFRWQPVDEKKKKTILVLPQACRIAPQEKPKGNRGTGQGVFGGIVERRYRVDDSPTNRRKGRRRGHDR